ncbi:MAG TPA: hypothetical protein VHW00_05975 [Thermoanaerobaculia bacterium]|nr:hypothetical protein [Thermoanaerobaculia bacterium]
MKFIRSTSSHDLREFVRDWVALLANGQFEDARSWLYRSERFSAADLQRAIQENSTREDQAHGIQVTDPRLLSPDGERFSVVELIKRDAHGRTVHDIDYYLPINERWSSTRMTFFVREIETGKFVLELTGISSS